MGGRKRKAEQMPSLFINSGEVKYPVTVANAFSVILLLTVIENLKLHQVGSEDAFSFLKDAFPVKLAGIKIVPATETEIKSILHSLK